MRLFFQFFYQVVKKLLFIYLDIIYFFYRIDNRIFRGGKGIILGQVLCWSIEQNLSFVFFIFVIFLIYIFLIF